MGENVQLREPKSARKPWETGNELIDAGIKKTAAWALGKYEKARRNVLYGGGLFAKGYEAYVTGAVRNVLHGANYMVDVKEVDANTLKGKGVLGRWVEYDGRKTAYIPETGAIAELTGNASNARGKQDYIRIHEVMEAYLKPSKAEHTEFDAMVISCLERLSYMDTRASAAYRGALEIYSQRKRIGDKEYSGIRNYIPIDKELERHGLGPRPAMAVA
jgi:hypothetical protein